MADAAPAVMSTGGAIPLSPAAAGGRRRKLKLVTRKAARKALKKMGLKMRGGGEGAPVVADSAGAPVVGAPASESPKGGRRHRKTKKHSRKSRKGLFGY